MLSKKLTPPSLDIMCGNRLLYKTPPSMSTETELEYSTSHMYSLQGSYIHTHFSYIAL